MLDAEESELREGRVLEFVVREYLSIRGMVKRYQLHFVEIGDLSQLLRNPDLIALVHCLQGSGWNPHVLTMVDRKVAAIAIARPQGSHAQHVSYESKLSSVPDKNHRA